jgi:hypothetical protein
MLCRVLQSYIKNRGRNEPKHVFLLSKKSFTWCSGQECLKIVLKIAPLQLLYNNLCTYHGNTHNSLLVIHLWIWSLSNVRHLKPRTNNMPAIYIATKLSYLSRVAFVFWTKDKQTEVDN